MNLPHDWMNELQGLLDRLQDGGFTEADRLRLNELLQGGMEAQDFFVSYLEIGSGLAWDGRLESDSRQPVLGVGEPPFGAGGYLRNPPRASVVLRSPAMRAKVWPDATCLFRNPSPAGRRCGMPSRRC